MHDKFLLAALEQAKKGRGFCAPNPSVGAVAVQNGAIIAQSWHQGAGCPHAEQNLIQELPDNVKDICLYVTLEPCNHWGRTPPCTKAIIEKGIKKVIYAYSDPNPLVAKNNTPEELRQHGVECIQYPLAEINEYYQSYHHWTRSGKPYVTTKLAQTLDGMIAGKGGERVWLSNACCAAYTHQLRKGSDVIMTTAETIIKDDPELTARPEENKIISKPLAILDSRLRLSEKYKAMKLAKINHIFYDADLARPEDTQSFVYHPVSKNTHGLDLEKVLSILGGLGYQDLFVEAGARLHNSLHQQGLVQQSLFYLVPKTLGIDAVKAYPSSLNFDLAKEISWQAMDDNMLLKIKWERD